MYQNVLAALWRENLDKGGPIDGSNPIIRAAIEGCRPRTLKDYADLPMKVEKKSSGKKRKREAVVKRGQTKLNISPTSGTKKPCSVATRTKKS